MAYLLIVDDDDDFCAATAMMLRKLGHEVQTEPSPEKALAQMEKRRPELVLLDVMFPEDDSAGFELARHMKCSSEKLKNIPLIMLTALKSDSPLGFIDCGTNEPDLPAVYFLEKPIKFGTLISKINSLLT